MFTEIFILLINHVT